MHQKIVVIVDQELAPITTHSTHGLARISLMRLGQSAWAGVYLGLNTKKYVDFLPFCSFSIPFLCLFCFTESF